MGYLENNFVGSEELAEKHFARIAPLACLMAAKVVANCDAFVSTCDSSSFRGVLPDPFDLMNHAGNTASSALYATLAAGVASVVTGFLRRSAENVAAWRNRVALATGTATAIGFNCFVESIDSFTSDPMDIVYGVGAGALAASLVIAKETPDVDSDAWLIHY